MEKKPNVFQQQIQYVMEMMLTPNIPRVFYKIKTKK